MLEQGDLKIRSWTFVLNSSYVDAELHIQIQAMMHNLILQVFCFDKSHHHLMLTPTFESLSKGFPHV